MNFTCPYCTEVFLSHSAKANHIRWHHKKVSYSDEARQRIAESTRRVARRIFGESETKTEKRICKCGVEFEVTFRTNRKLHVKKTCSPKCAHSVFESHSNETKEKISNSIRSWIKNNPEKDLATRQKIASKSLSRFSSKAERALFEALGEGFKRHLVVRTDSGIIFDVDVRSDDSKVWIESDGSWHFRKIHSGHDFESVKARDRAEEIEAIRRGSLLIRLDNEELDIETQVSIIRKEIEIWDRSAGKVIKRGSRYV